MSMAVHVESFYRDKGWGLSSDCTTIRRIFEVLHFDTSIIEPSHTDKSRSIFQYKLHGKPAITCVPFDFAREWCGHNLFGGTT